MTSHQGHQDATGTTGQTTGAHRHQHGQQGMMGSAEQTTGVKDKTYNVVSVLYHALQGSETAMQYLQDARQEGDQQLVQFFEAVQECQRHLAMRAKDMLLQHMNHGNGHEAMQEQSRQGAMAAGSATSSQGRHKSGDPAMAGSDHGAYRREEESEPARKR